MGWYQRKQEEERKRKAQEEKAAAEQAKKDQEAAARAELTNSWKDLYNSGGDAAVSQSILNSEDVKYYEKHKKWQEGSSYNQKDYNAAVNYRDKGKTFRTSADEAYQATWSWYNMITGNGKNTTKYGPKGESIYQIMPFSDFTKDHQSYDWSDGSYDKRIKEEKAAAEKAEADRKAEEKRKADELARQQAEAKRKADLEEAQRKRDEAAQAALEKKPAPTQQAPVKEQTPIEEAKGRAEEYKKTTTQDGNTITNNIEQNVGNKGDAKTEVGDDNTITNSKIGDDESKNTGNINVTNEQTQKKTEEQRGLAKEKAQEHKNKTTGNSNTITNNIEQNVGNKGDRETTIGDDNTITNSEIGNDKSENNGNINVNNQQAQEETRAFREGLLGRLDSLEAHNAKTAADKAAAENKAKADKAAADKAAADKAKADKAAAEQAAIDKKKKDKEDYVWGLAKEKASAYTARAKNRVTNGNQTNSNAYVFNNNFLQNTGNKGNSTTSFGNRNKLYNVNAGNDYSINLGNINNSNSNKWSM